MLEYLYFNACDFDRFRNDYMPINNCGNDGEGIATVEIAWPEHKVGFLTAEQLEDKEKLEQDGWKIVDLITLSDVLQVFGGKGR